LETAVETTHVINPNVLCLSRDPEAYVIQDENGNQVEIDEGTEVFLAPLNKTSPEVMYVDVTWDGHDDKGLPFRLNIVLRVHQETPRSRLLGLWIEHYKTTTEHAEIASHLFTDENEYYLTDHTWNRRHLRGN
jgi:hypothetical protein